MFVACREVISAAPVDLDSLDEASLLFGGGTYTVFRVFPGLRALRLGRHFERLRSSAKLLGIPFLHEDEYLRAVVRRCVELSGMDTPRLKLILSGREPEKVFVALEPFDHNGACLYEQDVRVGLAQYQRSMPQAKDSCFVKTRGEMMSAQPDVYEILLYAPDGAILEGLSSNFYAILSGVLRTAKEGVLEGVARSMLIKIAPDILPVQFEPLYLEELPLLDEAFLTSSSRGVVPVIQIGDQRIGSGKPGAMSSRLRQAYQRQLESELERV